MGRKKKKASKQKSWCWYCNREFDDDKILVQHQKAKHFKCHICHKKLYTGPGLSIHCMQVHKEAIDKVPNSLPNRSNIEIEIYGMEGIPAEDIREHERQKNGNKSESEDDEPVAKKHKPQEGAVAGVGVPGAAAANPSVSGMMMNMMVNQFGGIPPMMMGAVPGYPGMMQQHLMGGPPPRPLFPAAATSLPNVSLLQQQAKPTFPAYSNATISAPPTTNNSAATIGNASSKIMHPAEDLSLEEIRARNPKYRRGGGGAPTTPSSAATSVSSPNGGSSAASRHVMAGQPAPMTGAAIAQAAMMAQIPTSMAADQQNAALLAAQAMAQASQNQQKQLDDLNRAVMMQRFQAAAAGARSGAPPTLGMMQMAGPFGAPQMMRPMAFSPQTAALLGQNMMRHGPPGMPPAGRDYY